MMVDDNTKENTPPSRISHSEYYNPLPRHVDLYLDFEEEKNPDGTFASPRRARCRLCLKDWRWKDRRRMNGDGNEGGARIGTGSACILDEGEEFVIDRGVLGEGNDGAIRVHALIHAEGEKYKGELVEWGVI